MTYVPEKEYEINPQTIALVAKQEDGGQVFTEVMETDEHFFIPKCPRDIIDRSCPILQAASKGVSPVQNN
ncbi:Genetic competence transcription factor [Halobacillus karajensis]|uniref:Genetic competence transcription factor n=1 Tax=Halobacillus karajensis TaxID=195088 RepID=A0A024P6W3_9BACI|nr:Genetic competence transcription factor [Halobacillus karajensis]CDQ24854.1 Genetic competence transcription factor [Halobacillus karajensis]CDQ28786.1 Genetic competence transcription factor [Halobacillus karajensis]